MGNKEKILELLEKEPLSAGEIADNLSMDHQMVNTYLWRLKEKNLIKPITDYGRNNKYIAKKSEFEKCKKYLKDLYEIMNTKMKPKAKLSDKEKMTLKNIKEVIK